MNYRHQGVQRNWLTTSLISVIVIGYLTYLSFLFILNLFLLVVWLLFCIIFTEYGFDTTIKFIVNDDEVY